MDCKIIIAAHKICWVPEDPIYLPLQVGSAGNASFGFARDDTGDNISSKNPWYCELTGLYWAWKNLSADYVGLTHYRRYFSQERSPWGLHAKRKIVSSGEYLQQLLETYPVLLPARRNYFIESRAAQYANAHGAEGLVVAKLALEKLCPEYLPDFSKVMDRTWGHIYNMFIMRHDFFDAYCSWLFSVLEEIELALLDKNKSLDPRIIGFISERLLDVWIEYNKVPYKETSYVFMEHTNWPLKIFNFLKRKFCSAPDLLQLNIK